MRSLAVDQNDQAKLRYGRMVHEGAVVGAEFHQPCPTFLTREWASLSMEESYRGAEGRCQVLRRWTRRGWAGCGDDAEQCQDLVAWAGELHGG